ncbi:MAG TPA: hypothetical protein VFR34_04325 [Paracoccaceae bacterium]|nr:hypothetical protein [Paracoccaceae bacterium]
MNMRPILIPAVALLALASAPALAQEASGAGTQPGPGYSTVMAPESGFTYPYPDEQKLDIENQIADIVMQAYGGNVFHRSQLPAELEAAIVPGNMLPQTAPTEPAPERIAASLPNSEAGTRWVKVGGHLLELAPDGTIVTAVLDVLP